MSIEEISASGDGSVWMGAEWEEDSSSQKGPIVNELFQSRVSCTQRNVVPMKAKVSLLSRGHLFVCDGGRWNVSTSIEKDGETTRGSVEAKVEKQTESGVDLSIEVAVEARQDKNHNLETGAKASLSVGGNF